MTSGAQQVGIRYRVPRLRAGWELSEETMPESTLHDEAVELLRLLLGAWAGRRGGTRVVRNLAVRWDPEHPQNGVDPDVSVFSPPPSEADLTSVLTWKPGHAPPVLAIEVVSESNPRKDYVIAPDKYAASATGELWIFDPLLSGPASQGGPYRVQVWRRDEGELVRVYAGEGPVFSRAAGGWLIPTDDGKKLRISEDESGAKLWLTPEEAARAETAAERSAKEAERSAKEAERTAKEAALARLAELEAELAKRPG